MDCPKCNATQDDAREECVSCGLIFERWRRALERPAPTAQLPLAPVEPAGLPKWMVGLFVLIVIVAGSMWTISRREARARVDLAAVGKDRINQINNESIKAREQLRAESARAQRLRDDADHERIPEEAGADSGSLTPEDAVELLRRCAFRSRGQIQLPKEYDVKQIDVVLTKYPQLLAAQRSRLLIATSDGSRVTQTVGITGGIRVDDTGQHFSVDLGPRQISHIGPLTGTAEQVRGVFDWEWQERAAAELLLSFREGHGSAEFVRQGGVWRVSSAQVEDAGGVTPICGQ